MVASVKYRGEEVDVHYSEFGEYIPRTYECEGENPDIVILNVMFRGVDILDLLNEDEQEDIKVDILSKI
jgi:DNA-binding response OmpR family regulator